ncbi:NUDIX hydrolase [Streptomyces buecherae]|uniref:NUDIX hydrolase n=1 Tax=Streptomyces buecherae TaxID=2763006 RepID=UPI0035575B0E
MPVSEQGLPDWLLPVARAARTIEPRQLSRFLPPENGSGRQSAVLVLFGEGPPAGPATTRGSSARGSTAQGRGPAPTGEPARAPALTPGGAPHRRAATGEPGAADGPTPGAYAGARHPDLAGAAERGGAREAERVHEVERARGAVAPALGPPFVGPGGPELLLMERAGTLRSHAGQPSFPGGALDPEDGDPAGDGPLRAALREAEEETGLDPSGVQLFGVLPRLYIPVSEFVVTPVLGWWRRPSPVAPVDPAETARVFTVPVAELTDPANRAVAVHPSGHRGPAFLVGGALVWGFTAGVIDRILHFAGWERPWDRERHVPLDWRA